MTTLDANGTDARRIVGRRLAHGRAIFFDSQKWPNNGHGWISLGKHGAIT